MGIFVGFMLGDDVGLFEGFKLGDDVGFKLGNEDG